MRGGHLVLGVLQEVHLLTQPLSLLLSLIGIGPAGQFTALHLDTRYTHGTHTVHTRYTHGTHTVHTRTAALPAAEPHWHQPGWPAHRAASRHTVHTRYTHGTHTVHTRTAALPAAEPHWHQPGWPAHRAASRHTVHTRYTHGAHMVHTRYTHGTYTVHITSSTYLLIALLSRSRLRRK